MGKSPFSNGKITISHDFPWSENFPDEFSTFFPDFPDDFPNHLSPIGLVDGRNPLEKNPAWL
jgi:hypothetical protein